MQEFLKTLSNQGIHATAHAYPLNDEQVNAKTLGTGSPYHRIVLSNKKELSITLIIPKGGLSVTPPHSHQCQKVIVFTGTLYEYSLPILDNIYSPNLDKWVVTLGMPNCISPQTVQIENLVDHMVIWSRIPLSTLELNAQVQGFNDKNPSVICSLQGSSKL